MDPVALSLVMIACLFVLGAAGEMIFAKTQIPDVVWLIAAGVFFRVTGLVDPADLQDILPLFAALTLIIVLFDGGSKLVISELITAAPRATLLALLSFTLTMFAVAFLSMGAAAIGMGLPDTWTFTHGIMLGAIVGGSSSLVIMPSMELAKVEDKVGNLVGLESALTDAACVVVTIAMIKIIVSGEANVGATVGTLAQNFLVALAVGVAAGMVWFLVMRRLRGSPHNYPLTLATLILLYVTIDYFGGSSAMGILAFAIMVGNADAILKFAGLRLASKEEMQGGAADSKTDGEVEAVPAPSLSAQPFGPTVPTLMGTVSMMPQQQGRNEEKLELDESVRTVHTQLSFIIKSFFFTFIGLMLSPPLSMLLFGVFLGVLLLAARFPAVFIATRGAGFTDKQISMINISLPRGMAAGVLATMPMEAGMENMENLPSMVFAAVVTSIMIFAVGFKRVRSQAGGEPAPGPESAATPAEAVGPTPAEAALAGAAEGLDQPSRLSPEQIHEAAQHGWQHSAEPPTDPLAAASAPGAPTPTHMAPELTQAPVAAPIPQPPVAQPPVAPPPAAQPPVAQPPVAQPPVARPPVAQPPAAPAGPPPVTEPLPAIKPGPPAVAPPAPPWRPDPQAPREPESTVSGTGIDTKTLISTGPPKPEGEGQS